jgi:adenylate cyclase
VEIQEELRVRNAELPDNRRMEFRIGINLGDVVEEGERIYGDGVNITARVEGLAEAGGICISGTVYDSIKNKLSVGYESLGEHTVKNIKEPVRIYRMRVGPDAAALGVSKQEKLALKRWQWAAMAAIVVLILGAVASWNFYFRRPPIEPASIERMALTLPDMPSIAVLPFDNMSEDPKQEFFSDGITEDIITALSKTPRLFVIARNSTFIYKGKPVKTQQVAEDLGVRYVLEGSVRKSENKVRVTAQLIDALKGTHLWAEKYDRNLEDIFAIQDSITREIITALQVKLTEGEQARIWSRGTLNVKAQEKAFESLEHFRRFNPDDVILCRKKAEEALALDPNYPFAYVLLAWSHLVEVWNGWSKSPGESMKKAVELGQKTLELDQDYADAHALLGSIYLLQKKWDKAVEEGERAVELLPSGADVNGLLGVTLRTVGRPQEAISMLEKAIRLNPTTPNWLYYNLGNAHTLAGNYQEAIASLRRVIQKNPKFNSARFYLIAAYSLSDQDEEAKTQMEEYLKLMPGKTIENWKKRSRWKNETDKDLIANALRKVGFPEYPPLKLPDKPSIAVLPFRNLSGDPEQEFLSDGFTEDIITTLARLPRMFVIARESSFTYKGKSAKAQEVGRDLGVRYILEGSIQKSDNRVRISAQLIDAQNGHHLWAEKFDRDEQEIFKLRDDVIKEIAKALEIKLTEDAWLTGWMGITENFDAYIKVKQSLEHFREFTPDGIILSRQKAKEALELDPDYSGAIQMMAWTLLMDGMYGTSKTPEKSIEQAFELAQKALDKGDDVAGAHYLLGFAYIQKGQFEKGVLEAKMARDLFPNSAEINAGLGMILSDAGRPMEAIPPLKKAMRLNPIPPSWYFMNLGSAYLNTEQYEKAVVEYRKALQRQPDNMFAHLNLVVCYVNLNRQEDAHAEAEEVLTINPKFSIERYAKTFRFADQTVKQRRIDAMRKAGLPE